MKEPEWVLRGVVLALHEMSLSEHGGSAGLRDEGLLDSVLGKPLNQFAHGSPSAFDLAASHACGVAKNRPFIDGNERMAFVVAIIRKGFKDFYLLFGNNRTLQATDEFLRFA